MDGEDLMPLLAGKDPGRARDHFTQGYGRYLCCRDERRVMFCRSDGAEAHLFDAINDVAQGRDLAEAEPETVRRMYEEYARRTPQEDCQLLRTPHTRLDEYSEGCWEVERAKGAPTIGTLTRLAVWVLFVLAFVTFVGAAIFAGGAVAP
jgi:hypothetical protein